MAQYEDEIHVEIDRAEADEAVAVLGYWRNRTSQLPRHLRDQLDALSVADFDSVISIIEESRGRTIAVVPAPALRALVANLRAQMAV